MMAREVSENSDVVVSISGAVRSKHQIKKNETSTRTLWGYRWFLNCWSNTLFRELCGAEREYPIYFIVSGSEPVYLCWSENIIVKTTLDLTSTLKPLS